MVKMCRLAHTEPVGAHLDSLHMNPAVQDACMTKGSMDCGLVECLRRSEEGNEELRCVLAVVRHGDRTPKQKMKMKVTQVSTACLSPLWVLMVLQTSLPFCFPATVPWDCS